LNINKKFLKPWQKVKIKYFIDNGLNFMIFRLFLIGSPCFLIFALKNFGVGKSTTNVELAGKT